MAYAPRPLFRRSDVVDVVPALLAVRAPEDAARIQVDPDPHRARVVEHLDHAAFPSLVLKAQDIVPARIRLTIGLEPAVRIEPLEAADDVIVAELPTILHDERRRQWRARRRGFAPARVSRGRRLRRQCCLLPALNFGEAGLGKLRINA